MSILVVVVTYHSNRVITQTLNAVFKQLSAQDSLVLVNNGGTDIPSYAADTLACRFIHHDSTENLGFCGGNNLGLTLGNWQHFDAVLLLNPDLILPDGWLVRARDYLRQHQQQRIGILSGPLISYDFEHKRPLPRIDSLGIGVGRIAGLWQDMGQGQPFNGDVDSLPLINPPEAICGALMLIPRAAIKAVMVNGQLFDERFSSYKEDIDLSLRMGAANFSLIIEKSLLAYHGRGWNADRRAVPYHLRLQSARNDILLHWKNRKRYLLLSLIKWCYVRFIEKK